MSKCVINFQASTFYSLAFQQNQYPLITSLILSLDSESEELHDIKISLTCDPVFFDEVIWQLDYLTPGQEVKLQLQGVKASVQALYELTDKIITNLRLVASVEGQEIHSCDFETTMLPKNYWAGEANMPELLAAFSLPNSPYSEELVVRASNILKQSNLPSQLDGYQSNTREQPYQAVAAIWAAIQGEGISYINPSPSFATSGQRIRITEDIKTNRSAACLDLSMLFASVLERAGLNTLVALTKTHAFIGVWLIDNCFSLLTMDDPMAIRKRVAMRDMIVFETTLVAADSQVSFSQACAEADLLLGEGNEEKFVYALDISQARKRNISPLPIRTKCSEIDPSGVVDLKTIAIPPAPVLPPVNAGDIPQVADTPETRIDLWQSKLLDLTKRNRLLNLAQSAIALRLFCPYLESLKDMLADGETFRFIASDETPLASDEGNRRQEIFKFETGNNLQVEFAKEQLNKKIVIANDCRKKMESKLLSLYRKAKNDFEEGGSNTLFLSIGMLHWKEDDRSKKESYKAPLILIPIELVRTSAKSAIRVKQLKDGEPIFNLTLIEFLQKEHEISLNCFRSELPTVGRAVDIHTILNTIRHRIKDIPGFEVVEELVLSTFSFTKYLMWLDLKDRVNDLKSNLFVEHLIDRPHEVFSQSSQFIEQKDVDEKIKPSELYAPLNADSSQVTAIEASGHAQDFVMEGPPGTGKSETIANIICHNLAKGRRILFVAEKMAALNVVYERLQKVGIGHLCLELHSNKASKTAVLDQLRRSWEGRNKASQTDWKERAEKLYRMRSDLNAYVDELHKESVIGISPRRAISRSTRYKNVHSLSLEWPRSICESPVKTKADYQRILDVAKNLGLAYKDLIGIDLKGFSLVEKQDWSNFWQADLIGAAKRTITEIECVLQPASELINQLKLGQSDTLGFRGINALKSICGLLERLQENPTGIALSSRVKTELKRLDQLADLKEEADTKLCASGVDLGLSDVLVLPTTEWSTKARNIKNKMWPFSAFTRVSLRSAMKKNRVGSYKDVETTHTLNDIKKLCVEIKELAKEFEADKIWKGWDTSAENLRAVKSLINEWSSALHVLIHEQGLSSIESLSELKSTLDTQWENLQSNVGLFASSASFMTAVQGFDDQIEKFKELAALTEIQIDNVSTLKETLSELVRHERELNYWCKWLDVKQVANSCHLNKLVEGLEGGSIDPEGVVEYVKTAVHTWLADILIDESDILRRFSSTNHEALINEFRLLDAEVARTTSDYIIAKTASLIPEPGTPDTPPAYGFLSKELQKKARHKPVRQLVETMGDSLLNLTPCMMMSPLSVAQFLPATFNYFDLVVFDEASQITVWDAVGAIARGKNSIIVGDPKQMPPTNFFNRTSDDDENDEDLESILDQALAARMPHHRLTGHYRSRHESLIAFSNSNYYENSLVTFPSAETKETAVTFNKVDGLYAKGKGRNNIKEAQAVADEIVRRLKDPKLSKLSIGVVTLNTEQKVTVEDELDSRRRKYPEIEQFFHRKDGYDPVFVKNLESVQGVERDLIILSIGYGPTEPNAKTMSMNFGPLNKNGGHRRFNVAVTRATTEVVVFASFNSGMIDLTRTQATAVKHLKDYMEFAEHGLKSLARVTEAEHGIDQFDSDFEQAVAFALRDKGWIVQTQVGVGKFRIDMGIVHPEAPGVYLAGIESDGATYHSSPAARDRDRVRQVILENLGWSIIRLWSTSYFINPEGAIEQLDNKLKELLELSPKPCEEHEIVIEEEIEDKVEFKSPNDLDKKLFFEDRNRSTLIKVIKEILTECNGIFLSELASKVGKKFGLARTKSSHIKYIYELLQPWAGISDKHKKDLAIWLSPDDVVDVIEWRGIAPFGEPRKWQKICFEEQLGIAKYALNKNFYDPITAIKQMFTLSRLNQKTSDEFSQWVENYTQYQRNSQSATPCNSLGSADVY